MADHQAGLMALAGLQPKQQGKILDILFDATSGIKSVGDAILFAEQGRLASASERKIGSLRSTFEKLDDSTFDLLMDLQAQRVLAWAARRNPSFNENANANPNPNRQGGDA
ncbi:MAG: hypothetical protein U5K75_02520 [Ahrensia sp.]|nr:hypothetical protein [Ahrensia sp.]